MAALLATVNPGDEVIVFEPVLDENDVPDAAIPPARDAGVCAAGNGWDFDAVPGAAAERRSSARTKALKSRLTREQPLRARVFSNGREMEAIAALSAARSSMRSALTDEIDEYILYDEHEHINIATLPGMRERTMTIKSGAFQDVQHYGLADRLHRIAPAALTDAIPQAAPLPHGGRARAVAGGGGGRPQRARPRLLSRPGRLVPDAARPAARRARRCRLPLGESRRVPTTSWRTSPRWRRRPRRADLRSTTRDSPCGCRARWG